MIAHKHGWKFNYFVFDSLPNTKYVGKRHIEFGHVIKRYCDVDVHWDTTVATVAGKGLQGETRIFGTTTSSLKKLGKWLETLQVADVAMESTEIFWKPVIHVLREFPLNLFWCQCKAYKKRAWRW